MSKKPTKQATEAQQTRRSSTEIRAEIAKLSKELEGARAAEQAEIKAALDKKFAGKFILRGSAYDHTDEHVGFRLAKVKYVNSIDEITGNVVLKLDGALLRIHGFAAPVPEDIRFQDVTLTVDPDDETSYKIISEKEARRLAQRCAKQVDALLSRFIPKKPTKKPKRK